MISRTTNFLKKYFFVISILIVSSILRWILILRGGQFYFPDESRYGIAQDAIALLLEGKVKTALLTLLSELAHIGFKVTALIPALLENRFHTTLALPAIFFSFFSILTLLLIWKLAIAIGASAREANFALFLAASSQVLLYYSRHLFPYDESMFFGLLALFVALKNQNKPGIKFLSGVLSFLCLATYNGYWPMAAFALVINIFNGGKEKHWFVKRSIFLGIGFLTPLIVLLLVCFLVGKDFFGDYGVYLQKIVQGSFDEGWSLPFEYFWYAEHWFIVLVGLFTVFAIPQLLKKKPKVLYVGLGGTLFIYLCLIIPSFSHTFVVYARTARQLMPFLVLTAAYGLSYVSSWRREKHWLVSGIIVMILAQVAWNYQLEYKIIYPRDFIQEIQEQHPDFVVSSKMMRFYAPLICQEDGLVLINFHYIYHWTQPLPPVQGDILMSASHPVNFLPHQYDGYTPEERKVIRKQKFEMVLYRLDASYLSDPPKDLESCNQVKNGG